MFLCATARARSVAARRAGNNSRNSHRINVKNERYFDATCLNDGPTSKARDTSEKEKKKKKKKKKKKFIENITQVSRKRERRPKKRVKIFELSQNSLARPHSATFATHQNRPLASIPQTFHLDPARFPGRETHSFSTNSAFVNVVSALVRGTRFHLPTRRSSLMPREWDFCTANFDNNEN
jgi:hypothetical protein